MHSDRVLESATSARQVAALRGRFFRGLLTDRSWCTRRRCATLRPKRLRICFGVAGVSSKASWSSCDGLLWLPPPSSTKDATPRRGRIRDVRPLLNCLPCNERVFDCTGELPIEQTTPFPGESSAGTACLLDVAFVLGLVVAKYVLPFLSET